MFFNLCPFKSQAFWAFWPFFLGGPLVGVVVVFGYGRLCVGYRVFLVVWSGVFVGRKFWWFCLGRFGESVL